MKKVTCSALAGAMLLWSHALPACANDMYYPFQTFEEYHRKYTSPEPAPSEPPAAQPQPAKEAKPPLRPEQPIKLTQAPEFLFPPELGFGVAVGIPYDLFYLGESYYLLKTGTWYRAASYQGPWRFQGVSRVPPELRKHNIAKVREIRNREFAIFWKDRASYKGRYFRPEEGPAALPKKEK